MFKSIIYLLARWTFGVFCGCAVAFFAYYLIHEKTFNLSILLTTGVLLWLLGLIPQVYYLMKTKTALS